MRFKVGDVVTCHKFFTCSFEMIRDCLVKIIIVESDIYKIESLHSGSVGETEWVLPSHLKDINNIKLKKLLEL